MNSLTILCMWVSKKLGQKDTSSDCIHYVHRCDHQSDRNKKAAAFTVETVDAN